MLFWRKQAKKGQRPSSIPVKISCANITKLFPVMKAPQKRALATVLCDRRVVYETVSQHPLQLLWFWFKKSCTAVLWRHAAALRQPQDNLRCCKGSETVTQYCCMCPHNCCTALDRTKGFTHKRRASCAYPQHNIIFVIYTHIYIFMTKFWSTINTKEHFWVTLVSFKPSLLNRATRSEQKKILHTTRDP